MLKDLSVSIYIAHHLGLGHRSRAPIAPLISWIFMRKGLKAVSYIEHAEVQIATSNMTGQVSGGTLRIRGPLNDRGFWSRVWNLAG
jgi:hypothetical protein